MDGVVTISILLPSSRFIVDAEIVRCCESENGILYGVSFVREDESAREELNMLIENIKEREDRLSKIMGMDKIY
jgi:hypothetical protein